MNAHRLAASAVFLLGTLVAPVLTGAQKPDSALAREFSQTVRPFVDEYCTECHGGSEAEAQFDLMSFTTLSSVLEDFSHWTLLMERLNNDEMPPISEPRPPARLRQKVIDWVKAVRA